jgi:RNA polymerase-binding protein DksA
VTENNARNSKKSASKPAPQAAPKAPPVKSPLTKSELKEFYTALIAKRRELIGDMAGIENEALGADRQESKGDISDHPADAGTDNFEQEFSLGLLESERTLLGEIDEALRRIEEGTYGICVGTGMVIGKARLMARPWSKYGIEYARMVEKGLVRPGDRASGYGQDEGDDRDEDDDEPDSETSPEGETESEAEAEPEVETESDSDVE